jgi:lysophospholipase L1-like esterase
MFSQSLWRRVAAIIIVLTSTASGQTRIMPLGDSITHGGQDYASYRYMLWFDLQDAGYDVDFVGQRDFINGGGSPDGSLYPEYNTTFDRDHEGYWGWRTDEILGIIGAATAAALPDIVLIHLGTNDIGQNGAAGTAAAEANLPAIIAAIRAVNADVTILLGQVIPIGPGTSYFDNADQIAALNTAIATIVATETTAQSPVLLVDHETGYALGAMMQSDGLHPNELGESHMSANWLAAVETLLTPGNPSPTVALTAPAAGAQVTEGDPIAVSASASDPNGTVVEVQFYDAAVQFDIDLSPPYESILLDAGIGTHVLTAVAVDDEGATQTSAAVLVTVVPDGDTVTVFNPSFEEPVLSDSILAPGPGTVGGWEFSASPNTFLGIFNPPAGSYPDAGGNGTPAGADGVNAAYLFNNGGAAEFVVAAQTLGEVVEPETIYSLIIAIGKFLPDQPYVFSTYGGYDIALTAGGTVIGSDSGTVEPAFGEFIDAVVTVYSSTLDPALLGQPLGIRLTLAENEFPRSTHFDNVRLIAQPELTGVPAASTTGVIVLATVIVAIGAIVITRRRETAA